MKDMLHEYGRMAGTAGSFIFGMFIKMIPPDLPDVVTWSLQNLAFIATIVAAYYTIQQRRRNANKRKDDEDAE